MNIVNIPTNGVFRLQMYLEKQNIAINLPVFADEFNHEIGVDNEFITVRFRVSRSYKEMGGK